MEATLAPFDFSKRKPTIEEQLETLIRVGISPNEYFSLDDAVEAFGRQAYDRKPYLLLLCVLGGETEKAPYHPRSNHIWHLDTECIEDHGDYIRVAKRMALLSGNDLPIEQLEDYVDVEEERGEPLTYLEWSENHLGPNYQSRLARRHHSE